MGTALSGGPRQPQSNGIPSRVLVEFKRYIDDVPLAHGRAFAYGFDI
jgi:hypothetical protein